MHTGTEIAACLQNKVAAVSPAGFCTHTPPPHTHAHAHTQIHTSAADTPMPREARTAGCAWTRLKEVQRVCVGVGVCVSGGHGVCFRECVSARALARPRLPAPVPRRREQQRSVRNFLRPRRDTSRPRHRCRESHLIMKVFQRKRRSPGKGRPGLPRGSAPLPRGEGRLSSPHAPRARTLGPARRHPGRCPPRPRPAGRRERDGARAQQEAGARGAARPCCWSSTGRVESHLRRPNLSVDNRICLSAYAQKLTHKHEGRSGRDLLRFLFCN